MSQRLVSGGAEIDPYELDMARRSGEVRRVVIEAQRLLCDDDAPRFLVSLRFNALSIPVNN